ncbi:MAG TPA: ATP-binding protein [Sphingomicrobium sp.]|jgi:signal transduction histidine kinase|nr:ATP-binding protein [Sphingomicrobium sp.]
MRKIAYALVAGSLLVGGAAYAASSTTPAKDQVAKTAAVRPFGRLEPSRNPGFGGHGLGLAIVDQGVRSHGGEWSLTNMAEGGLEIRVALPLAQASGSSKLDR